MGQLSIGDRQIDTDVRRWEGPTRRDVSLFLAGIAGVFLLASFLYYGLDASGSGWFLWVAIVTLALLLLAQLIVLVTGIAREEEVGPPWLAGREPHAAGAQTTTAAGASVESEAEPAGGVGPTPEHEHAHEVHPEIDLQCPQCSEMFTVQDTGERPLATQCPHCQAQGHVNLPEPEPEPEQEPAAAGTGAGATATQEPFSGEEDPLAGIAEEEEPLGEVETISLSCPACETQFDVEDTGERPLRTTCPGCGKSGKLS